MNSRDVIKRLRNDVGVIDVPSIPQAVRQAVREQREKYIAYYGQAPEMKKSTRDMVVKGIFAAMVTAMVVSVPIIVVMTNRSPISDLPDTSVLPNSSGTVSAAESQIVTSTEQSETTLERIKLQQVYGEVALSGKSEEELETLLVTYSTKDSVYEDDRYIYNFDSQGRLVEMRNLDPVEENSSPANGQEVSEKAMSLLKEYYSVWINDEYSMRCEEDINSNPIWYVYFTKSDGKLIMQKITMTFDKTGTLRWMIFDGTTENIGIISKAEAVQIAIKELRSGKYDISDFNVDDVDIMVAVRKRDNEKYYFIEINNIIVDEEITIGYYMEINAYTGKIQTIKN